MKTLNTIMKILAIVAAIAGIVYVVITYGDKILAWTNRMLGRCREWTQKLSGKLCACKCGEEQLSDAASEEDFAAE